MSVKWMCIASSGAYSVSLFLSWAPWQWKRSLCALGGLNVAKFSVETKLSA